MILGAMLYDTILPLESWNLVPCRKVKSTVYNLCTVLFWVFPKWSLVSGSSTHYLWVKHWSYTSSLYVLFYLFFVKIQSHLRCCISDHELFHLKKIVCLRLWCPCLSYQKTVITINSLAPRRFERNFREVISKLILVIDGWGISFEIVLTWTAQDLTDDQSTLVQVMAWCHQATSHYLSQCWHRSLSLYDVTRPQWVKDTYLVGRTSQKNKTLF